MKTYGKSENVVEERDFTEQETAQQAAQNEEDFIKGLIEAADFKSDERKRVEIVRNGKALFAFEIRPLTEDDYNSARKKHSKKIKNKRLGIVVTDEVDAVKYRDQLIYQATVPQDRKKLWDNQKVWSGLIDKGIEIISPLDVIEFTLKAGEKDQIIDLIDKISGFDTDLEETAKN